MPIIAVIAAQTLKKAVEGDPAATKLALDYFTKYVAPKNSGSIADLMDGQSPFALTAEEMASISKGKLLKEVT